MSTRDSFGDRMKRYENVPKNYLTRRIPAIIRIDGKSFHTYSRGFVKPFDKILTETMQRTMEFLCKNIQGCVFGYTQSDEITLVLTDYATLTTDAWFGYNVEKMCSIAASMATMVFNRELPVVVGCAGLPISERKAYDIAYSKGAMFDARVFSLPKEEVCNCLIWRQQDAIRNSIQSVGQFYFGHTELQGKSCADIKEMLVREHQIDWYSFPVECQRGSACYREPCLVSHPWRIDREPPVFTQDRAYIERFL